MERARAADALVVYVNDNHGDWTAGRGALTEWPFGGDQPALVKPIDVQRLVLVGQVTEQCSVCAVDRLDYPLLRPSSSGRCPS